MGKYGEVRYGEARYGIDALLDATEATASTATQMLDKYADILEPAQTQELEEIRHAAQAIVEVPEEERNPAWVRDLAEGLRQANATLQRLLEEQIRARIQAEKVGERRERKEDWRWWVVLGVTIVIAIVGWARGLLLDIIHRLLGG